MAEPIMWLCEKGGHKQLLNKREMKDFIYAPGSSERTAQPLHTGLEVKRAFMQLSASERAKLLQKQAAEALPLYQENP